MKELTSYKELEIGKLYNLNHDVIQIVIANGNSYKYVIIKLDTNIKEVESL